MTMRLTALDVGIHHLAMASFRVPRDWSEDLLPEHLERAELVNVSEMTHERIPIWACRLHHAREISDWLDHVVQEREEYFSPNVEHILVERQPPEGIKSVEQYLFKRFRERVQLVAPIHVQTVLGFRIKNEYDARKTAVVKLCWDFLVRAFPSLADRSPEQITDEERFHDLADAIAIARSFFLDRRNDRLAQERKMLKLAEQTLKKQNARPSAVAHNPRHLVTGSLGSNKKTSSGRFVSDDVKTSPYFSAQALVSLPTRPSLPPPNSPPKFLAKSQRSRIDDETKDRLPDSSAESRICYDKLDEKNRKKTPVRKKIKLEETGSPVRDEEPGSMREEERNGLLVEKNNVLLNLLTRFPLPADVRKRAVVNSVGFQPA